ncbi:MAG: IPT/TIG domain-containing protein, partial [Thermoanaerobaculia bacterium]
TIFGRGFDEPVAVTMGQHAQQVLSVSGSEIVVRTVPIVVTGCADVTGPTAVVNIETGDGDTNGPSFTYRVPRPTIFSVSPFGGPQSGNTLVTITGANFASPMIVDFVIGGTAFTGNLQSSSSTTITVRSPAIPNSVLDTQTCDDNGNPVPPDPTPDPDGERYLAVTANVRITDPATGCTAVLNGVFSFTPTDQTCRGD